MPRSDFEHPLPPDPWLLDRTEGYQPPTPGEGGGAGGGGGGNRDFSKSDIRRMSTFADIGQGGGDFAGGIWALMRGQSKEALRTYQALKAAYANLDDPEILKKIWNFPIIQQIAQYQPWLVQNIVDQARDFQLTPADAGIRAQHEEALGMLRDRAVRGAPQAERVAANMAAGRVGRGLARGGASANEYMARLGRPGGGIGTPGLAQGASDYASDVGAKLAINESQSRQNAEARYEQGVRGSRQLEQQNRAQTDIIRANMANAVSNRDAAVALRNQQERSQTDRMSQNLAQRTYEMTTLGQDQRRIANQRQRNQWAREGYSMDRRRLDDRAHYDTLIAQERDRLHNERTAAIGGLFGGAGKIGGALLGLPSWEDDE